MRRLFGQGKAQKTPAPTLDDASVRLGSRGEVIDAKVKKLDDELLKLRDQIQKTRGPQQQRAKQRALQLLQQKRTYEKQRESVYQQQFSVDQLQFTTETMKDTKLQVQAMKDAGKTLKKEFKGFRVEDVEKMQDELVDLYEEVQEIQEVMGRAYGVPEDVDEDDLGAELDALAFDMEKQSDASYLDQALSMPTTVPTIPGQQVPNSVPEQPVTTDPASLEAQLGL